MSATVPARAGASASALTVTVKGMTCAACVRRVERGLVGLPGVREASVNLATEEARITFGSGAFEPATLEAGIKRLGYDAPTEEIAVITRGLRARDAGAVLAALRAHPAVLSATYQEKPMPGFIVRSFRGGLPPADGKRLVEEVGRCRAEIPTAAEDLTDRERDLEVKARFRAFAISALLSAPVLLLSMGPMLLQWSHAAMARLNPALLALTTPVLFYGGAAFFAGAFKAARNRTSDMNTLVALGTTTAWAYSAVLTLAPGLLGGVANAHETYFDTTATLLTLVLLGRWLEARARRRTSGALTSLLALSPRTARVVRDGTEREVPVEDIGIGETLRIRPGERVPVDGQVLEGVTALDESLLTGESLPVEKGPGQYVTGGSLNQAGAITIVARRVGRDTTLARIVKLVKEAQGSKAPVQHLADCIAAVFVPTVVGIALLSAAAWAVFGPEPKATHAILRFVAVLIIACPCALGLATPTAIIAGTGRGAELGILFRNAEALEQVRDLDVVAFDKTGTLTTGRPEVSRILPTSGCDAGALLTLAATAAASSEHPLSAAIVRKAHADGIDPDRPSAFSARPGRGIEATVGTRALVLGSAAFLEGAGADLAGAAPAIAACGDAAETPVLLGEHTGSGISILGVLGLSDPLKPEAREAVARLRAMGLEVAMLTGDNARTAARIAGEAGIGIVRAQLLPEAKREAVVALQQAGRRVAMVGDGINDAPALASADLGIAMGSGTDVALEAADIALMSPDLRLVPKAIELSRRTVTVIRQNLFWAFAYNVVGIPLAAGALTPFVGWQLRPEMAALAMALSSVSVVTSSLRLHRFDR